MKAKIIPKTQTFTIVEDEWKDPREWKIVTYVQAFNEEHAAEIFIEKFFKNLDKEPYAFYELQGGSLTVGVPVFPAQKINIFLYQIWPGKFRKRSSIVGKILSFIAKDTKEDTIINCWFTKFLNLL
jgi:hypothetical protein